MTDQIEPFVISVDGAALADLHDRLRRTRWPEREPVRDWSQGVPLSYLQDLCGYWARRYDWRAAEARLNQIPQFTTTIDGLDIHFLHVRSPHPSAVPLVMTHGWPGSFLEFEQALGPLTDPPAHGGDPADAFDVVLPSLPGYGFSGKPASADWDIHRIARAWAELMTRLGYRRFLAMGSDWGTSISTSLALQHPGRLVDIHLVPPLVPPDRATGDLTGGRRAALADLDQRTRIGSGYSAIQGTRPQTIGYSLTDSPAGLCAYIAEKLWAWTDHPGDLGQVLTAAGPSAASPTSCTGTSPVAAVASPPGNNPACSPTKSTPWRAAATVNLSRHRRVCSTQAAVGRTERPVLCLRRGPPAERHPRAERRVFARLPPAG